MVLLLRLHEHQGEELMLGTPQLVGLITAALLFAGRFEQAARASSNWRGSPRNLRRLCSGN